MSRSLRIPRVPTLLSGGLLCAALACALHCAPDTSSTPGASASAPTLTVYYYRPPGTASANPADIVLNNADEFQPLGDRHARFGLAPGSVWLRLEIQNAGPGATNFDGWLELAWPHIDYLDFFEPAQISDTNTQLASEPVYSTGRSRAYSTRQLAHRHFVFPLRLAAGEERTVYLRANTASFLLTPLRLVSRDDFASEREDEGYLLGFYYGLLALALLYSLFIYRSLQEPIFLAYSCYVLALGAYQLATNGIAAQFWPELPELNRYVLPLLLTLTMLTAANFVVRFLNLRQRDPALYRSWQFLCAAAVALLITTFIYYPAVQLLLHSAAVFLVLALWTGLHSWRRHRATRIFVFAWLSPVIGFLIQLAASYDYLPEWSWLLHAGQIGSGVEVVLLSLALADRIRALKREQQIFETRLENRVQQRTGELNLALSEVHRESELTRIELDIAAGIQKGIMPAPSAQTHTGQTITYLQSLAPVGGDYYDVFEFPENGSTAYLMADASGHGIPAALITTMAKICFMDATRKCGPDPRAILLDVNDAIARLIKTHEYLTAAMLIVDEQGSAYYASAGHRRSFHFERESGKVYSLDTEGILLGIYENNVIPATIGRLDHRVSTGDRLLMFTDGFADVKNSQADRFGEERLEQLLTDTAQLSLADAQNAILDVWREFQRHGSRDDDCTFTLIEFKLGGGQPAAQT